MALNDDEKKLLAELTERAKQPDADDDFEIEVYDTTAGKGARIPFRQGKNWLFDTFGIGDAPAAAPAETGAGTGAAETSGTAAAPQTYFGRKK